ncbi:MAG: PilN domain-containing protein [Sedimentisphaerales bacterium]|nr:PilN domain-containing protein [Sedimentisphaerales bacterium]
MKQLDFLPEDYVERKAQQRTNIICLSLFLVVLAGVGCGFAITESRQERIDEQLVRVNDEMKQADQSLRQLELLEQKRQQMMKKASVSASLMESVPRSLLIATVTNNLPAGVSLRSLELDSKEVKPVRATPDRRASTTKKKVVSKSQPAEEPAPESPEPTRWETSMEIIGVAPSDLQVAEFVRRLHRSTLFKEVGLVFSEEEIVEEESLRHFKLAIRLDPDARASEQDVEMARESAVSGM